MVKTSSSILHKAEAVCYQDGEAKMGEAFASKQRGIGQRRSGKKWRDGSNQKTDPKVTSFTSQEEDLIIQLHSVVGSRWSMIAQQLQEKTESDVKNVWNSKLKKKLSAMGIDPVTHKPFSQILADYGAFPRGKTTRHHALLMSPSAGAAKAELSTNEEVSSFSWSDFFMEEAFAAHENGGDIGDEMLGDGKIGGGSFDAEASSSSSAFLKAMIGKQDEMCSQLPCFYEEPF